MDWGLLFTTSFLFLIVLDPIGNIPIFISVLRDFEPKYQFAIIMRELFIALAIMLLFFFFGTGFFTLLNIEQSSLQVAGSTTLFLIGVKMLFSAPNSTTFQNKTKSEPFIVPLATPAVAGPGIIATVMLYGGNQKIPKLTVFLSLIIAWLLLVPCLLAAPYIKKYLKENGIIAAERLFAYLVILISVQMAISGLQSTLVGGS
jgi:multiple antibiotic resistance protein